MRLITRFIITLSFLILSATLQAQAITAKASGYINVNNGKLYYQTFGSGTPLIVLHGGPGLDQSYLLPQMAKLATNNEVTFYDQRGCGKSLGFSLDTQTINVDNFVQDLEMVRKKLNYNKFILIGHSWGGLLAMNYAVKYPEHLSGVVLLSSAPSNTKDFHIFQHEYTIKTAPLKPALDAIASTKEFQDYQPKAIEDYYRIVFSAYFFNPEKLKDLSLTFTQESARSGLTVQEIFVQNYFNNYDLDKVLQKLNIPVVAVHGVEDIIPIETIKRTIANIPNAKLVTIKNCDHFPYIEQPEAMFSSINKFIAENNY